MLHRGDEMAKTHTSTDVKRRYNEKVYSQIAYQLPKDLVEKFKDRCGQLGVSQRGTVQELIERFLEETK